MESQQRIHAVIKLDHELFFVIAQPPQQKAYIPINCAFLSKFTFMSRFTISAKNSFCVQDLRAISINCKYLSKGSFEMLDFKKVILKKLQLRQGGWEMAKLGNSIFCTFYEDFPDRWALLEYFESHSESFRTCLGQNTIFMV